MDRETWMANMLPRALPTPTGYGPSGQDRGGGAWARPEVSNQPAPVRLVEAPAAPAAPGTPGYVGPRPPAAVSTQPASGGVSTAVSTTTYPPTSAIAPSASNLAPSAGGNVTELVLDEWMQDPSMIAPPRLPPEPESNRGWLILAAIASALLLGS